MFDISGAPNSNIKSQEYTGIIVSKYPGCKVVLCYGVDAELGVNEVIMRTPGVVALDDVSLSFEPGETHSIMGENGACKSTLKKLWPVSC